MVIPVPFPIIILDTTGLGDDLADSYLDVTRFIGNAAVSDGVVQLGVNDEDTVLHMTKSAAITEGSSLTVHNESGTNYQNNTSFDAIASIILEADDSGALTRHIKVRASTTADTADGTVIWETGQTDTAGYFNANSDKLTTPSIRIPATKFLTVENVDDARAGTNNVLVLGVIDLLTSAIVERGA